MASLVRQVQQALLSSAALTAIVGQRVYDRPLKLSGHRSTPEAFDLVNRRVLPSLVIRDDGDVEDLRNDTRDPGFLSIWMHGPDTDAARETLSDEVRPIVQDVLTGTVFTGRNGTGIEITPADRYGLREDSDLEDAVVDYVRFNVMKLRSLG